MLFLISQIERFFFTFTTAIFRESVLICQHAYVKTYLSEIRRYNRVEQRI